MILKGIPAQYNTFTTVVARKDREMSFIQSDYAVSKKPKSDDKIKCDQSSCDGDITNAADTETILGSCFQDGNNSGKGDTVAFHGACNEDYPMQH